MSTESQEYLSTKRVFTTGEAAEVCKVSQQTIIRCFDSGRLTGFRVPGSKFRRIPREELIRALNRIGYTGPLSIEWEDSGMDREYGARDALAFVRRTDFAPSAVAFDAAMQRS